MKAEKGKEWLCRRYHRIINLGVRDYVFVVRTDGTYSEAARYVNTERFIAKQGILRRFVSPSASDEVYYLSIDLFKGGVLIDSVYSDKAVSNIGVDFRRSKFNKVYNKSLLDFLFFNLIDAHYDDYLDDWLKSRLASGQRPPADK